jgi:hypothetical protein
VGAGKNAFTWDELKALAAEGFDVQAHSKTHGDLRKAPNETDAQFTRRMQTELEQPLSQFQQRMGSRGRPIWPIPTDGKMTTSSRRRRSTAISPPSRCAGRAAPPSFRAARASEPDLFRDDAGRLRQEPRCLCHRGAQVRRPAVWVALGLLAGGCATAAPDGAGTAATPSSRPGAAPPATAAAPRPPTHARGARGQAPGGGGAPRARGRAAPRAGPLEDRPHDRQGRRRGPGRARPSSRDASRVR